MTPGSTSVRREPKRFPMERPACVPSPPRQPLECAGQSEQTTGPERWEFKKRDKLVEKIRGLVLTFGAGRAQFSGQAPPSRKMCQRSGATPSKALA